MKNVVYTCITNNYDVLNEVQNINNDIDFICFTDNPYLKSYSWSIVQIPNDLLNIPQNKIQRMIKILPHRYLKSYDISLWIDGNLKLKSDVDNIFNLCDINSCSFYTRKHPSRNCIYKEADAVLKMNKDVPQIVNPQIGKYRCLGFPSDFGLYETNVIVRRHNDKKCQLVDNLWANELLNGSHRDQLSLNYVLWKTKVKIGEIDIGNLKSNEYIEYKRHS